jgi:hypothetical protein
MGIRDSQGKAGVFPLFRLKGGSHAPFGFDSQSHDQGRHGGNCPNCSDNWTDKPPVRPESFSVALSVVITETKPGPLGQLHHVKSRPDLFSPTSQKSPRT